MINNLKINDFSKRDLKIFVSYLEAIKQPSAVVPMTLEQFAKTAKPETLQALSKIWQTEGEITDEKVIAYLISQQAAAIDDGKKDPHRLDQSETYILYHATTLNALKKIISEGTFRAMFMGSNSEPNISCSWGIGLYCSIRPPDKKIIEVLTRRAGGNKIVTLRLEFPTNQESLGVGIRQRYRTAEIALTTRVVSILEQTEEGRDVLNFLINDLQELVGRGETIKITKWRKNFAHRDGDEITPDYNYNFRRARLNEINRVTFWDILGMTLRRCNFSLYSTDVLRPLFEVKEVRLSLTAGHRMITIPRSFMYEEILDLESMLETFTRTPLFIKSGNDDKYIRQFESRRRIIKDFFLNFGEGNDEILCYFLYPSFFRLGV